MSISEPHETHLYSAPKPIRIKIQSVLREITGLEPVVVPIRSASEVPVDNVGVNYVFKAKDEHNVSAMHDYIKRLVMEDTKMGYQGVSVSMVSDPNDHSWSCVAVKFTHNSGSYVGDSKALQTAQDLKQRLQEHITNTFDENGVSQGTLENYHRALRKKYVFAEAQGIKK